MKVCLFATWISQDKGGIENMCYNIYKQLDKQNSNDLIAFSLTDPNNENAIKNDNIIYSKKSKRTVPILFYLKQYIRVNKEYNFDVNIAAHVLLGAVTLVLKVLFKKDYIVLTYGKEVYLFKNSLHRYIVKLILNNAKEIITISDYTADLTRKLTNTKVTVIHPGMDEEAFCDLESIEFTPVTSDTIKILSVGRLVKRKGVDNTIRAVKLLVDEGYKVSYYVIGGGEYENELQKLVTELDLQNEVKFLGKVSTEDKYKYIKSCDIFAMPSYEIEEDKEVEGFGIVYLEANARGKIAIGGNSGGVPSAILDGKTGYLVNGLDPIDIKNKIIYYVELDMSEQEKMYNNCIEWSKSHSWDNIFEQYKEVLSM